MTGVSFHVSMASTRDRSTPTNERGLILKSSRSYITHYTFFSLALVVSTCPTFCLIIKDFTPPCLFSVIVVNFYVLTVTTFILMFYKSLKRQVLS